MDKATLIRSILKEEWNMFSNVKNKGGKAECQNDFETFALMRTAQLLVWGEGVLASYYMDLENAKSAGRNLMMEKYAYMMKKTHPAEFNAMKHLLPEVTEFVADLARVIVEAYSEWERVLRERYPKIRSRGRRGIRDGVFQGIVTMEDYQFCELITYSERTLIYMIQYMGDNQGKNLYLEELNNIAVAYGYKNLDEAENAL